MKVFFATLAFLVGGLCFAGGQGGSESGGGNGGDPLVTRFQDARRLAAEKIKYLTPEQITDGTDGPVKEFFLSHQLRLAEDVMRSPHAWTMSDQITCGRTGRERNAVVRLSYVNCAQATLKEAVGFLIHESVHHFGYADEEFADRVARLVLDGKDNDTSYERNHAVLGAYLDLLKNSTSSEAERARAALARYRAAPTGEKGWDTSRIVEYRMLIGLDMLALAKANGLMVTRVSCPSFYPKYVPKMPESDSGYGEDYLGHCEWDDWTGSPKPKSEPSIATTMTSSAMYLTPVPPENSEPTGIHRMGVWACTKRSGGAPVCSYFDMWSGELRDPT